jgi:DNA-binding NtrC family response regulator
MKTSPPTCDMLRILLVDHDSSLRESVSQTLKTGGFLTSSASNRHEALDLLRQEPVDLVLLNMLMPGAEAIGTIIAIQAAAPLMRIIAMAGGPAASGRDFLPLAKSLGASALLNDPLDSGKLLDAVHQSLAQGLHQMAS